MNPMNLLGHLLCRMGFHKPPPFLLRPWECWGWSCDRRCGTMLRNERRWL